ncbi:hypothetical protein P5673_024349 [Acropora cervicornis]|uniref:Uncharacterized protein n=1 Tax=Acropora cervicornis TaxID=6130 RepID=A0AAD9Q469_ACRCE|nr:hypothetical protein P5673_024349 [Acropora cervicornis]
MQKSLSEPCEDTFYDLKKDELISLAKHLKLEVKKAMRYRKVDKDHDKLRQVILIEEFKRCIHSDVRTFIDEQKAETLEDAARLAEEFSLSHKVMFVEKPKRPYPPPGQDPPPTPGCFGNQRSHQSEDLWRKQNPVNNSANRSKLS